MAAEISINQVKKHPNTIQDNYHNKSNTITQKQLFDILINYKIPVAEQTIQELKKYDHFSY